MRHNNTKLEKLGHDTVVGKQQSINYIYLDLFYVYFKFSKEITKKIFKT